MGKADKSIAKLKNGSISPKELLSMELKKLAKYYERVIRWSDEDGAFVVSFPELPGCITHGETSEEAAAHADEACLVYLETLRETDQDIPEPRALIKASGKLLLRMEPDLHKKILETSKLEKKSANEWIVMAIRRVAFGEIRRHAETILEQKKHRPATRRRPQRTTRKRA